MTILKISMACHMRNFFSKKIVPFLFKKKTKLTPGDIGSLVSSNKKEDYNSLWSSEDSIKAYMVPNRLRGQHFIADFILSKGVSGRVVDIGFGTGDFLRILLEKSEENKLDIFGLDYSDAAVARAQKNIPSGKFITGDVYNLPYEDNYFDLVACIQTLEHLSNPIFVIREFDRVCNPNGLILISIPNGELDDYEGHVNFWNVSEFKDFLSPRTVVDCVYFNNQRAFFVICKPLKNGN